MATRVDPDLLYEIKQFGAVGVEKCINCGNCTAICSLTSQEDQFPRYMIRLAQLGMKDKLLGSKELWLCYNCGDCSETCPQQAEPANFMAAVRCYAITNYDPLGLGRLFCKTPIIGGLVVFFMIVFFGLFMFTERETMASESLMLFDFIPYEWIHTVGLIAMILIGIASVVAIFNMMSRIAKVNNLSYKNFFTGTRMIWSRAFWDSFMVQSLGQKRYREECESPENIGVWFLSKWFVHAATMWGFLGLLLATILNYLLDIVGLKATGTPVPIWYPIRMLGTLSGLLFVYGVSILIFRRLRAPDKAHSYSRPSDWIFLVLLWVSGMTGFVLEIALYLPQPPEWGYWMFIVHVAFSMVLLLLLPFTKFAHAIYRIVALYVHALKPASELENQQVDSVGAD
jgi:nitrate reductase gamma subunit/ferredoxin